MDFELTSDQKNFQNLAKDFSDKDISLDDIEKLSKALDLDTRVIIDKKQ